MKPITIKSPEARRELAKVWPPEMVALLKASAQYFGHAEEIIVQDEPTIRHMREWRKGAKRG
jgi:hypothetical protein